MEPLLWFDEHAQGRAFHAARVRFAPRSGVSSSHRHADFYELMCVTSGAGEHVLGGRRQKLSAGDVVLVRPRDRHAFSGTSPDGLEFVNVAFPAGSWTQFVALVGIDPDRSWDHGADPVVFRPANDRSEGVRAAFETALRRFYVGPTQLDLIRYWTEVLSAVTGPLAQAPPTPVDNRPRWLADACAAMADEENLREGLPRLLYLCNVSPAHLSRTMRADLGVTPTRFLARLRLEHAASLLTTTTEPVTSIALRCGFSSQSYFTRCFQGAFGITPRDYRRRAQRAFVP